MRRVVVASAGVAVVASVVVGVLAWLGAGPFRAPLKEYSFSPTEVRTLGEGGDPLVISVMFPWGEDGVCSGQFTVTAVESASSVVVSQVKGSEWPAGELCADLGTPDGVSSAELTLRSPLGDRTVTRAQDGAVLPVLDPCERQGVPSMCPRLQ